ncbi:MAG: hypothetical protein PHZ04_01925 [Patescibacteria group bacterium]|nr:hypothetical protein [Patescibacteria group bacterium]
MKKNQMKIPRANARGIFISRRFQKPFLVFKNFLTGQRLRLSSDLFKKMIRRSGGIYRSAPLFAKGGAAFDIKKPPAKIDKSGFH